MYLPPFLVRLCIIVCLGGESSAIAERHEGTKAWSRCGGFMGAAARCDIIMVGARGVGRAGNPSPTGN